jgi:drug/metabolite transporter (DMT)-like permease
LKTAGIVLLVLGLLMTLYTGFTHVTKDKVVDLGDLQITKDKEHSVNWQPYLGVGAMIIGGVVLVLGRKKSPSA